MEDDPRTATQIDELVETELARDWLRPGERLVLACPPIRAHVGVLVAGTRITPYAPGRALPSLTVESPRWPLPVRGLPGEDWIDDPTLGHWAVADTPGADAVRFADHLAASHGEARTVVTDRRVAVVCPTKHLTGHPAAVVRGDSVAFTTLEELPPQRLAALDAPFLGRSVPPRRVIAFSFRDGSVLHARDVHAAMKVLRARHRTRCRRPPAGAGRSD